MTKLQKFSASISWFVAGIGGLLSLLICFAVGMKAAPRMEYTDAVIALPLPIVGATIAWLVLSSCRRHQHTENCLLWTVPPISIAALSIVSVLAQWLWSYFVWDLQLLNDLN